MYEGTFYGVPNIHKGFTWLSKSWVWISMSFDASKGQFTGTAMAVVLDRTSITVATPLISKSENQQTSSGGSTVIPSDNGFSVEDGIFDLSLLNGVLSVAPYENKQTGINAYIEAVYPTGTDILRWNSELMASGVSAYRTSSGYNYLIQLINNQVSINRNDGDTGAVSDNLYLQIASVDAEYMALLYFYDSINDLFKTIRIGDYENEYLNIDPNNDKMHGWFTSSRFGKSKTTYAEFNADGELGINTAGTIGAKLHVKTTSTYGKEAVKIEQVDQDQAFIDYEGTSAANTTKNICTMNGGGALSGPRLNNGTDPGFAYAGMIKIEINGTSYWMPYFSIDNP